MVVDLSGLRTGSAHLSKNVLADGVRAGATSIMFRAQLPERMRKGHQPFLPRDDTTLSALQLLLRNELLLQLNNHRMRGR
jgi:hypothetical protein